MGPKNQKYQAPETIDTFRQSSDSNNPESIPNEQFDNYVQKAHEAIARGEPREEIVRRFKKTTGRDMPMEPWTPESEEGQRDQQKTMW